MVVKNIIAEDMPFTKSIFEQFWRSYCKKTIFVVFHFLKFLPFCHIDHAHLQVDRLEDDLMLEQEKHKAITEELEQTFAELSGY